MADLHLLAASSPSCSHHQEHIQRVSRRTWAVTITIIGLGTTIFAWLTLARSVQASASAQQLFSLGHRSQTRSTFLRGHLVQTKLTESRPPHETNRGFVRMGRPEVGLNAFTSPKKIWVASSTSRLNEWTMALSISVAAAVLFTKWLRRQTLNGVAAKGSEGDLSPSVRQLLATLVKGESFDVCPQWNMSALADDAPSNDVVNVAIVGSGPAGFTAAIYAARANLRPIVFEGYKSGGVPGGQLMFTTEVENFPGFPEGITGPELMERMQKQAVRWGATLYTEDVEFMDLSKRPFVIRSGEREIKAQSVILATGATAKRLGLPNEDRFWSRGISACAICDGASPLFKGQELAVVGGGDTALEEAVYLTKYGSHIHVLVRGDALRASKAMADRVARYSNITVHYNTGVVDAYADASGQRMAGLLLKDTVTNETRPLPVAGVFYGIGHTPNSIVFQDQVQLDEAGYVVVRPGTCETNIPGVFAAGDLQDHEWRQAITAAGSGCMAALSAERFLVSTGSMIEYEGQVHEHTVATEAGEKPVEPETEKTFDISQTNHTGEYALRKLYHESDRLLGVLYTSPSCGPCRVLKPVFGKVVDEYADKMHYVLIDIEESPQIAEAAGVNGTPTVQFFRKKAKVGEFGGVKMKKEYRDFIEQHI